MKTAPYTILYEDENILVVYKNRDVLTMRTLDKKTFSHNLYHYLYLYLRQKDENLYIVHRLDYETSGILLFAKSKKWKEKIQKCFEDRKVNRLYEAVIREKIPLGIKKEVTLYLTRGENGKKVQLADKGNGVEAITFYQSVNYIQIGTALKISIKTGRRNQIRLTMKEEGFTLIGDKRYAFDEDKRMYLNSYELGFPKELGLRQSEFKVQPLWIKEEL